MKITIAKALNLKNKLVGEKDRLFRLVSANNSRLETTKTNYDVSDLFNQFEKTVVKLTAVKAAISTANATVYDKIYRISELKSMAANIKTVNTDESDHEDQVYNRVTGEMEKKVTKRTVVLKNVDIDNKIKSIEAEIEKLQDELSAFNHLTQIEVPE